MNPRERLIRLSEIGPFEFKKTEEEFIKEGYKPLNETTRLLWYKPKENNNEIRNNQ